ncbi:TetR/AcrR family transcriptional regulator C-terminal domain-containing protein [Nocardioides caeni]|uniref:Tetracycline repressor TetR C-terminal domain-containing protein n=1 Tax=Nocardioides caeni TaxID=574700 RepID=A0A4S8N3G0_9ACTN|nr:TetR/AcrR family transcriptional regulator C-terminal domain-containing protein [Nocardioides caeni]THV10082.1 hypothetical protein E9934_14805 [Nocardioides caeni]
MELLVERRVLAHEADHPPYVTRRAPQVVTGDRDLGLDDIAMDQAVALLDGIGATAARSRHAVVAAERQSGQSELEWWEANAEALGEAMGGREFPLASRVGQAAGELYQAASDPDRQFRFALDTVIAGLTVRLAGDQAT